MKNFYTVGIAFPVKLETIIRDCSKLTNNKNSLLLHELYYISYLILIYIYSLRDF